MSDSRENVKTDPVLVAELQRRSIPDDVGVKYGLYSVDDAAGRDLLEWGSQVQGNAAGIAIPYDGGKYRVMLFNKRVRDWKAERDIDEKLAKINHDGYTSHEIEAELADQKKQLASAKYMSVAGESLGWFIRADAMPNVGINDPKTTLYVVEGEFKAIVMCSRGYAAVAIGGITNAFDVDERLADSDDHKATNPFPADAMELLTPGRHVVLVPDNDMAINPMVLRGAARICEAMRDIGVDVEIGYVPAGPLKGVDDYIVAEEQAMAVRGYPGRFDVLQKGAVLESRPIGPAEQIDWYKSLLADKPIESNIKKWRNQMIAWAYGYHYRSKPLFHTWAKAAGKKFGLGVGEVHALVDSKLKRAASVLDMPTDDKGKIVVGPRSLEIGIRRSAWHKRISYNTMRDSVYVDGSRPLADDDIMMCMRELPDYGINSRSNLVHEMMTSLACESPYNPVQDYLNGLAYHGKSMVPELMMMMGSDDSDVYIRKALISAVARALDPGCKVDTMLVMHGVQGTGKSTFGAIMGGEYFSDAAIDIHSKDGRIALKDTWIMEMQELAALRGKDNESIKAFLGARSDKYRDPYGKTDVIRPRRVVFFGTVNTDDFLTDPTGDRRYWVVQTTKKLNPKRLVEMRDQLWAEAVAAYKEGMAKGTPFLWWLTPAEEQQRKEDVAQFQYVDPLAQTIEAIMAKLGDGASISEIWHSMSGSGGRMIEAKDGRRIGEILKRLGYVGKATKDEKRKSVRRYYKQ